MSVCTKTFVSLIHIMSDMPNEDHVYLGVCQGGVGNLADVKAIEGVAHSPKAHME